MWFGVNKYFASIDTITKTNSGCLWFGVVLGVLCDLQKADRSVSICPQVPILLLGSFTL